VQSSISIKATQEEGDFISLRKTSIKLDVSEKTVRRLIDDGELGPLVKIRGSSKLVTKHVRAYKERLELEAERKTSR
jgi:DeoR/GlpR family transcriptional regulator of sugar metabolism